jgi:hypothetical protein
MAEFLPSIGGDTAANSVASYAVRIKSEIERSVRVGDRPTSPWSMQLPRD